MKLFRMMFVLALVVFAFTLFAQEQPAPVAEQPAVQETQPLAEVPAPIVQNVQPVAETPAPQEAVVEKKEEKKEEKSDVPEWVKKIELKGDFKFRYQYNETDEKDAELIERSRLRYTFKLGLQAKINDWSKVAIGLVSGAMVSKDGFSFGQDARSTSQTMDDVFSHKPVWTDYAYVEMTPFSWLTLIGGKMKNPLHTPTELLWSSTINPEGAALALKYPVIDQITLLLTGAVFLMDEIKAEDDPMLPMVQGGAAFKFDDFEAKLTASYYGFAHLYNADPKSDYGKMLKDVTNKNYNFRNIACALDASYSFGAWQIGLFGELVYNLYDIDKDAPGYDLSNKVNLPALGDRADQRLGYAVGLKGGSKAIKDLGDVQGSIYFRSLDDASWLTVLTDDYALGGRTNAEGIRADLKAGLMKNFSAGINFYYVWTKNTDYNLDKSLSGYKDSDIMLQIDLNYKF